MRILAIVAVASVLSGCSTFGMSAAQVAQMDQQKCTGYGFKIGTDAYASCMQNIELARAEDDRTRRAAFRAVGANLLNNEPSSVTCSTTSSSFGSMGHSTTTCR